MNSTLIQMTLIMACGVAWRVIKPAGLTANQTRLVLTSVVYYLFLPALVLDVLWTADIGLHSFQYTLLGMSSIFIGVICSWLIGFGFKFESKRFGALILAAAFPNVTYLGLPVLEQVFGSWARSVVIQIDLFAASPLVFTLAIKIAQYYGEKTTEKYDSMWSFLNTPALWAAVVAVMLNLNGIVAPLWLTGVLQKLSIVVAPLMLFSLGLALSWSAVHIRNIPYVLPVIIIKMILMPLFAIFLMRYSSLDTDHNAAAVLDIAMPSMVLGIVYCDRYQLDSSFYAMAVTITTVSSLIFLPFWYGVLLN